MAKHHKTVCLCSICLESGRTYLYVQHEGDEVSKRRKKGRKLKLFSIELNTPQHEPSEIEGFVAEYEVEKFRVIDTEHPHIVLVHVEAGYPRKEGKKITLCECGQALEALERHETLYEGIDGIEAIRKGVALLRDNVFQQAVAA